MPLLDRRALLGLLVAEAVAAGVQLQRRPAVSAGATRTLTLPDGRYATVLALDPHSSLPGRIIDELETAETVVVAFWGQQWRRDIRIVCTGTDAQFGVQAGGGSDFAASTTANAVVFAPGAAAMSQSSLRIVLRHELFHYASRAMTAADAPYCLAEGVADYVGRPHTRPPANPAQLAVLPTNADFENNSGAALELAYDRAWWFARFVADRYGEPTLRQLYLTGCRPGHPDLLTAVHQTLGLDRDTLLRSWRQWLVAG